MREKRIIAKNIGFIIGTLIATITFFIGVFFVMSENMESRKQTLELETSNNVNHYNLVLHTIFHNILVIETYVNTVGIDNITQESFDDFVEFINFEGEDFVSFSIAPSGIIEFYYSKDFGEGLIGYDLVNDEREYVRTAVEYAIDNKVIVVNGPFELIQGDKGLVFRKPLFDEDEFVGLINFVVDYDLLAESFNSNDAKTIYTSIYDENKGIVFGDAEYTDNIHYYEKIDLEYVNWSIGIQISSEFDRSEILKSAYLGSGFTLLYLLIMYLWSNYYFKTRALLSYQNTLIKYDNLTSLPNRRLLNEETNQLIEDGVPFYLGFGDLDNFKNINDVLGHTIGDQYLSFVAKQFDKLVENNLRIYRWGGDEFIFVFITEERDSIIAKLDNIFDIFKTPFDINGSKHQISISVGVVHYPNDGANLDELIKHADIVMYDIKAQYKNTYSFFEEKYLVELYQKIEFQQKLDDYQISDFEVFLQPIIDVKTNEVKGFEGLSRLFDKDGKLIPTFAVIKRYEQDGKITNLDKHVFHQICKYLNHINKECEKEYFLTFNISPLSLNNDYIEYLRRTVNSYKINPKLIIIEVIETLGFKDIRISIELLNKIKDIGFKIAMDDFGMGYSSLSYLAKLPFDIIKIDKSFVQTYESDAFNKTILRTIQEISETLNLETLVEGIETQKQLDFVLDLGTNYYQGYLHSKPQRFDEIMKIIRKEEAKK